MKLKIGDKIRFLNAVGGGIVKGFQNKDIVLVEEEDGFETPVLIRECILVAPVSQSTGSQKNSIKPQPAESIPEVSAPEEKRYRYEEVAGRDLLNVYLAFLPMDIKNIGKCNYETYLINDSNYFLSFNYMSRQDGAWISRHMELIEPNTRLFIEEFSKGQLNDLETISIQFIAFKKEKPYSMKRPYSIELRIDGVRFYKLHSFRENDFFEDAALVYPLVTDDVAEREMLISAADLQEAMSQKKGVDFPRKKAAVKSQKVVPAVEVDLHINQLLDSTVGLSNGEILQVQMDRFHRTLEEYKQKRGQKIVFIHGKGEGVLRNAILKELKTKYKNYPYQDASFREYGFGATMITIP